MILKNKTILVTGIGKGIGESICKIALQEGAFVYGLTRNSIDKKKFKNLKNLKIYIGNSSNLKILKEIFKDSKKNNKFISGIVNNAGIRFRKKFLEISKQNLNQVFENNFFSIFFLIQYYLKEFKKNNNNLSIVNIGSIVGKSGFKELSGYASSKSALLGLGKSLNSEYGSKGIRINTVNPGFIKTSYYKKFKNKKKLYNWTLSRTPSNRWGEPHEVANLVIFLLSDKASYINGEDINIDGGWLSS